MIPQDPGYSPVKQLQFWKSKGTFSGYVPTRFLLPSSLNLSLTGLPERFKFDTELTSGQRFALQHMLQNRK
jgi:hypothetical protein